MFAAHLIAAFLGSRSLWGFGVLRYLPLPVAATLWVAWGLALIPPLGRRVEPFVTRIGASSVFWFALTLGLVVLEFDRLHFLGDWLMRRGSVGLDVELRPLYPQALPLDLALHVRALRPLGQLVGVDHATRILGGLEAALFAVAALVFRSRLGLGPRAGFAVAAVTIAAGLLQIFTGFNKAACDVCVLTAAAMAMAVTAPRSGASLIGLGAVAALAMFLHRVGILLAPAVPVAAALYVQRSHPSAISRWTPAAIAVALPAAAAILVGPTLWRLFVTFDWPRHIATPGGPSILARAFEPQHVLDLVNALGVLTPLVLAGLLAAALVLRRDRFAEWMPLLGVAVPMSLPLWFVHPQQGVFRDLDVLAPSAVAIGFVAAWAIGRVIDDSRVSHGLAVAVASTCLACAVGWLALMHDANRAEGWVRGFTTPEARRSPVERALTWDFLGYRALSASNWTEAAHAWRETQRVIVTPRTLTQLAMAETMTGDLEAARSDFRRSLSLDSTQAVCWRGIATTSFRLGDYREARRAAGELQRRGGVFPELSDLLRALDRVARRSPGPSGTHDSLRNRTEAGTPPL